MSMTILLPLLLLEDTKGEEYAIIVTLFVAYDCICEGCIWTHERLRLWLVLVCFYIGWKSAFTAKGLTFCFLWGGSSGLRPEGLERVFTRGEWTLVTAFASVALVEWFGTLAPSHDEGGGISHPFVAVSGLVGTLLACVTVPTSIANHLAKKLAWLTILPLLVVEMSLRWKATTDPYAHNEGTVAFLRPACVEWLFDFLCRTEESNRASWWIPVWPNYLWLFYWAVVTSASLALLDTKYISTAGIVVVRRKWFHFVAVLLFEPVTRAAPQFMSLSYAIALAVLWVLEAVRRDLPLVNAFYNQYLDSDKDGDDALVISHMALISGCAAPLWLSEFMNPGTPQLGDRQLLVQLWGVYCLGIGDAAGAIAGTCWGRRPWGQRRTIEGSVAMWITLAVVCGSLFSPTAAAISTWVPAVTFVTVLEAYTLQIDNMILPLAGSAVILLTG